MNSEKNNVIFYFKKNTSREMLIGFSSLICFLILSFIYFYYNVNYNLFFINGLNSQSEIFSFTYNLIKFGIYFLMGGIVFLAIIMSYALILMLKSKKIATLNKHGILLRKQTFIPWESIDKISIFKPSYSSKAYDQLAIWLKKDSNEHKKIVSKLKIGTNFFRKETDPHLTFGSMDEDQNLKILKLSKEYMNKYGTKFEQ